MKGVRDHFDDNDNSLFSLVLNGLALFNGYIGSNGLMNVVIEPVSYSPRPQPASAKADLSYETLHRRLGHVGN